MSLPTVGHPHILQSDHSEAFERALGLRVTRGQGEVSGQRWSAFAFVVPGRLAPALYAPYGPHVDGPEALCAALEWLTAEAKRLNAARLLIEPVGQVSAADLEALGCRRTEAIQPEHTQIIPLEKPFDQVLQSFATNRRRFHRNHHKKGTTVRVSTNPDDVEDLIRLLNQVSGRTEMDQHNPDHVRTRARVFLERGAGKLFFVDYDGKAIAAGLTYEDDTTAYYVHAAADDDYRRMSPNSVLASNMIQDACESGKTQFDFYGTVPADVTDHPWSNFSEFKRSFGGTQRDYLGTWEKPVNVLKTTAARVLDALRRRRAH